MRSMQDFTQPDDVIINTPLYNQIIPPLKPPAKKKWPSMQNLPIQANQGCIRKRHQSRTTSSAEGDKNTRRTLCQIAMSIYPPVGLKVGSGTKLVNADGRGNIYELGQSARYERPNVTALSAIGLCRKRKTNPATDSAEPKYELNTTLRQERHIKSEPTNEYKQNRTKDRVTVNLRK